MLEKPGRSLDLGYEHTDASARGIFLTAFLALSVGAGIFVGMGWLFQDYERSMHAREQLRSALLSGQTVPPEPRLQLNPRNDLAKFRAENAAVLGSFGWIDRQGGWIRIPIEDAMHLLVLEQTRKGGSP
jgi:hypothetical protein